MKINSSTNNTISVMVIIVITYFVYWLLHNIYSFFTGLDEKTSSSVVATCVTALISVITLSLSQYYSKEREIENSHRPKKTEIYKTFMEKAVIGLLKKSKDNKLNDPEYLKELQELYFSFTGDIIIWGSPSVINAYSNFRSQHVSKHILNDLDILLKEMRRDLGNSNFGLKEGDLIKLFLIDPENYDQLILNQQL